MLGIYTTRDHINIKKRCIYTRYGQLLNRDMHPALTINKHHSRPLTCDPFLFAYHLYCVGSIVVQDYIPRKFSFSFGCHCDHIGSLKGLDYYIRINVSNQTNCQEISHPLPLPFYRSRVPPHLLGYVMQKKFPFFKTTKICYFLLPTRKEKFILFLHTEMCFMVRPNNFFSAKKCVTFI